MTLAVVGVLVVHNLVTNLWAADRWYVRANLAAAALVVWMTGTELPAGSAVAGVASGLVVLAALGVLATVRPSWFVDRRMAGVDARGTAWRALVRIPLGTVVLEEVAFRAVLPGLLSPVAAAALFGLWHILPTANGVTRSPALIGAAVVATAAVGLVLWELRVATGGLLAPALVHWAAGGGAVVAAHLVTRRAV